MFPPGTLVNASGITRNNWIFEYNDLPDGVIIQLTPSNDINQVIRNGEVIAVFSKDNAYDLQKFVRSL